jgi:hypothetical protein
MAAPRGALRAAEKMPPRCELDFLFFVVHNFRNLDTMQMVEFKVVFPFYE